MRTGLTVIAHITAQTAHQELVRHALLRLASATRKENGCITYDLCQSAKNPTEFAVYETWAKPDDLDAHAWSAHLQEFNRIAEQPLERPAQIGKWVMISELEEG